MRSLVCWGLGGMLWWTGLFRGECASPSVVEVFDTRPLKRVELSDPAAARRWWDAMHLLGCLQGLVNRDQPRLYLMHVAEFGVETDAFWMEWYRGEDGWLQESQVTTVETLEALLRAHRGAFDGVVVYDERVPATSCLASTAAGVERLLPVRWDASPDSLYVRLTRDLQLPVMLWLVNPDGTAKFTGRGQVPELGAAVGAGLGLP